MQFSDVDYLDTWKEMEMAYHEGLATNIGVSNFNSMQLERLIKHSKVKPVTNQVKCKCEIYIYAMLLTFNWNCIFLL